MNSQADKSTSFDDKPINLPKALIPENLSLNILYEDESIIVIDKPAGMVVHPSVHHFNGTLTNGLLYHFGKLPSLYGDPLQSGLVHRLDRGTSGVLIAAKNESAITELARQFYHHSIRRIYHCLCWGIPNRCSGIIKYNLGRLRSPNQNCKTIVYKDTENGKKAVTHFEVLEDLTFVSLVKCTLETGRTHQIRAHMSHIGHPLYNDHVYDGNKIPSSFEKKDGSFKNFVKKGLTATRWYVLHAHTLGFQHPKTKKHMVFEVVRPRVFENLLLSWRNYSMTS